MTTAKDRTSVCFLQFKELSLSAVILVEVL